MGRFHMVRWSVAGLILLAGLLVSVAGARAQDGFGPVPFTIHKSECPIDFSGSLFDACYDQVVEGVEFEIVGLEMGPITATTDADGQAVAEILDNMTTTSDIAVTESSESFGAYLGAYVTCIDEVNGDILFDGPADEDGSIVFDALSTDQEVVCDWYNFTEIDEESEGQLILSLPATGSGSTSQFDLIAALALVGSVGMVMLVLAVHVRRGDVIVRW